MAVGRTGTASPTVASYPTAWLLKHKIIEIMRLREDSVSRRAVFARPSPVARLGARL